MSKRVLIVEDDVDGQDVAATIVASLNAELDVAGDAAEAWALLQQYGSGYALAIIDLALPGQVDGLQLIAHIRATEALADLPCVAVTAFHTSRLREQAMHAGFTAYTPKPLDPAKFAVQLRELL